MATIEDYLLRYIRDRNINLSEMARKTGIPYRALYNSLSNKSRRRELRSSELAAVCGYLGIENLNMKNLNMKGSE